MARHQASQDDIRAHYAELDLLGEPMGEKLRRLAHDLQLRAISTVHAVLDRYGPGQPLPATALPRPQHVTVQAAGTQRLLVS